MRLVLDTNFWISALLFKGLPLIVLETIETRENIQTLTSEEILSELVEVFSREKFASRFTAVGLTPSEVIERIKSMAEFVEPSSIALDSVRDPKDLKFLACAVAGKADYIVTGDADLLVLNPYESIQILRPAEFLAVLTS